MKCKHCNKPIRFWHSKNKGMHRKCFNDWSNQISSKARMIQLDEYTNFKIKHAIARERAQINRDLEPDNLWSDSACRAKDAVEKVIR